MCSYLTWEQYRTLGGKADVSAFPRLEILARKTLDHWTQNRIKEPDNDIRLCMTLIIDALEKDLRGEKTVSSVSNDGLSVTYAAARTEEEEMRALYDQIVEILPVELVSLAVNHDADV